MLAHEEILIRTGARSGLPIIIAVHSTALGDAVGGCRLWSYQDWRARLDFGDAVQSLGGRYHAGEDVGTTAEDMWIARERTSWVHCLPVAHGGSGEPSELTAIGTMAAIDATSRHLTGTPSLAGRHVTIVGLGQVGGRLAHLVAAAGAKLTVADIDPQRAELARA